MATELMPIIHRSPGERLERAVVAVAEREELVDSHCLLRRVLKVAAFGISAAGKVAFLPVPLALGPIYRPFSVYGETASYLILEYWASAGMIDDFLAPRTRAQDDLMRQEEGLSKRKIWKNVVVLPLALVLALASQLPVALPGMDFAPAKYKKVAGLVLLLSGALTPLRSLQLSIEHLSRTCQRSAEASATEIKEKLAGLLMARREAFIQLDQEGKLELIQECNRIRALDGITPAEKTRQFLDVLLGDEEVLPPTRMQKGLNYAGIVLGGSLAAVAQYVFGDYTYETTQQELTENRVVAGLFASLTVGSMCYLFALSVVRTTQGIFNRIGHAATGKEFRPLSWQLRPKRTMGLTGLGVFTNLCTVFVTYVILKGFYQNKTERDVFFVFTSTSLVTLLLTSTFSILDDVISFAIARGSEEERSILALSRDFARLGDLIKKCPPKEFLAFLAESNVSLLARLELEQERVTTLLEQLD